MHSSTWEEIAMAFDALDEAMAQVLDLELDALGTAERFTVLGWCEKVRCRLPAAEHGIINALARQATPAEIGGRLSHVLADRLHITRTEAGRRIHDAEDLGARHALNGERLQPRLTATAAAQRIGAVNTDHVRVIRSFDHHLPGWVDRSEEHTSELQSPKDLVC